MKANVNSGGQSMIDKRFRFGLQGLGLDSLLLHCLKEICKEIYKKICSTLSLFAQVQ